MQSRQLTYLIIITLFDIQYKVRLIKKSTASNEGNYAGARSVSLEFHRILGEYSGNPVLYFIIDSIIGVIEKHMLGERFNLKSQKRTINTHKKIYSAL